MQFNYSVVEPVKKILYFTTENFEKAKEYIEEKNGSRKSFRLVIIKTIERKRYKKI